MIGASQAPCCANHPSTLSLGRCMRCRVACCDACIVFAINDDPWCEACGSVIEEQSKPRYGRGAVVLATLWGLVTVVWIAKAIFIPVPIPYFYAVLLFGYGGGMYAAWNVVSPVAGVEAPSIVRRTAGSPLPRRIIRS
jgi:hypothetical protein